MFELSGFQRDLLYVIAGLGSPHGLRIKSELESYYESEIHYGRLYPNLDTLVEHGFVQKGTIDRRTNSYTLTEKGRSILDERRAWETEVLAEATA